MSVHACDCEDNSSLVKPRERHKENAWRMSGALSVFFFCFSFISFLNTKVFLETKPKEQCLGPWNLLHVTYFVICSSTNSKF